MSTGLPIKIAVYFTEESVEGYPFNEPGYRTAYLDFFRYGTRTNPNVSFFVTRGKSYIGNGTFEYGEKYDPDSHTLLPFQEEIAADIIYNKGDLMVASNEHKHANIVNHPEFNRLCKDKMQSALFLSTYFPTSIEVRNQEEVERAIRRIPSKKVVLKPIAGQGGAGVQVLEKTEIRKATLPPETTLLVQEFLDTRRGIEGITKSAHDLRVTIMNGNIVEVMVRIPKEDNFVSNLSRGGSVKEIGKEELPEEITKLAREIDDSFSEYFPRIYSIDFGYTPEGPKIFELNSQPGLPDPSCTKYYHSWHRDLFATLLSSLEKKTFSQ